jgi:hypothetical protein
MTKLSIFIRHLRLEQDIEDRLLRKRMSEARRLNVGFRISPDAVPNYPWLTFTTPFPVGFLAGTLPPAPKPEPHPPRTKADLAAIERWLKGDCCDPANQPPIFGEKPPNASDFL